MLNFEYYETFVMILFYLRKYFFYQEEFISISFEQLKENIKKIITIIT